jgi:hypothetical protein
MDPQSSWRSGSSPPVTSRTGFAAVVAAKGRGVTDEARIRELIRAELEVFIEQRGWPDAQVQQALLDVAKDHLWKQGLMMRVKYWSNILGFFGVVAVVVGAVASLLGLEIARK